MLSERPGEYQMRQSDEFSFGDDSVAGAYDDVLVPILFEPWAVRLVEAYQPWEGRQVLDLATGTGIVARLLAEQVGPAGSVLGSDMNGEMLERAREWCAGLTSTVKFVECSAESLDCSSDSFDVVVCQQGFQFFSNKNAAVKEIRRALRDGGTTVVSTWRPVAECQFFGAICDALETIGAIEIADMMRLPFDFMPQSELVAHFETSGFANVRVDRQEQDFVMSGGVAHAIEVAYSTPIAPKLRSLPDGRQARFREALTDLVNELCNDGITMGRMASDVLSAEKRS
jgi:ubiquinone/menaquinone biosynthesis C-methylase UbiE